MSSLRSTLPTVASYLERLPGGIDAHPECKVKGSIIADALGDTKLAKELPLPPVVRSLLEQPPPVSVWVPEVYLNVLMLTVLDAHFGHNNVAGYLQWIYDRNRKLLSTMLYRALFFVLSPERLLSGVEKRWAVFRRGTTVAAQHCGRRNVELHVTSPPYLYGTMTTHGISAALRAAIDCAGAVEGRVIGELRSPCLVVYRITWRS